MTVHQMQSRQPMQDKLTSQTLNSERQYQIQQMESLRNTHKVPAIDLVKTKQQFATHTPHTFSAETNSPQRSNYGSMKVGGLARRRQNKININQNREMR